MVGCKVEQWNGKPRLTCVKVRHPPLKTLVTVARLNKINTSKTHQRINRTLFNVTKQDRMHIMEVLLFFKATNNTKRDKAAAT